MCIQITKLSAGACLPLRTCVTAVRKIRKSKNTEKTLRNSETHIIILTRLHLQKLFYLLSKHHVQAQYQLFGYEENKTQ